MNSTMADMEFCKWVGSANPGEKLLYHRGFLSRDIARVGTARSAALSRLARCVRLAADRGLVHPVQLRHSADDYSYIVILRRCGAFWGCPNQAPDRSVHLEEQEPPHG